MSFYLAKQNMFRTQENYSASKSQYLLATKDPSPAGPGPDEFFAFPTHKLFMNVAETSTGGLVNINFPVDSAQFIVTGVYCIKTSAGTSNAENVIVRRLDPTGAAFTVAELDAAGPYGPFDALGAGTACWFDLWQNFSIFGPGDTLQVQKQETAGSDVGCQLFLDIAFV
jgi:hypothetical protein